MDGDRIDFIINDDLIYSMAHSQDCCEHVELEDVCGDIEDLKGSEILVAEESSNTSGGSECGESCTYTFYTLRTNKGTVSLRGVGSSNGCYSEEVELYKTCTFERMC